MKESSDEMPSGWYRHRVSDWRPRTGGPNPNGRSKGSWSDEIRKSGGNGKGYQRFTWVRFQRKVEDG